MKLLHKNKELRLKLGKNAYERAKKDFDQALLAKAWWAEYEKWWNLCQK